MIVSVSRRTDIPAFYTKWFINRIRAGYCTVPNPFNKKQVSRISLAPENVDVIVFWTRNPYPLFPYLEELDRKGYRYYFQFTLMDNPRFLDRSSPRVEIATKVFKELAERVGKQKIIWRYDPIVLSQLTDADFHIKKYTNIAKFLTGYTCRSVISIMDGYHKNNKRLREVETANKINILKVANAFPVLNKLLSALAETAYSHSMEIFSCAEEIDMTAYGIKPGKCIDDEYIREVFGLTVSNKKDASQREACGCVISKDIGMYDSCLFGCQYCYATTDFKKSEENYKKHDSESPSLIGWHDSDNNLYPKQLELF